MKPMKNATAIDTRIHPSRAFAFFCSCVAMVSMSPVFLVCSADHAGRGSVQLAVSRRCGTVLAKALPIPDLPQLPMASAVLFHSCRAWREPPRTAHSGSPSAPENSMWLPSLSRPSSRQIWKPCEKSIAGHQLPWQVGKVVQASTA